MDNSLESDILLNSKLNVGSLITTLNDRVNHFRMCLKHNKELSSSELSKMVDYLKMIEYIRKSSGNDFTLAVVPSDIGETILELSRFIKNGKIIDETNLVLEIFELLIRNISPAYFKETLFRLIQEIKEDLKKNFNNFIESDELSMNYMLVLASIFSIILNDVSYCEISQDFSFLTDEQLHILLIDLGLSTNNKKITLIIFSSIVPTLIRIINDSSVFAKLWSHLSHDSQKDRCNIIDSEVDRVDTYLLKKSSILCILADYLIPPEKHVNSLVVNDENFWCLVYHGLLNSNLLLRKQSVYLAKRAIDYLIINNSSSFKTYSFVWDINYCKELEEIWTDFFIILEVLDEKQVHLVMPVLPTIMKIFLNKAVDTVDGRQYILLQDHWVFCICQRVFCHDSNAVVRWGLTNILKCDNINWTNINESFLRIFLTALNNTSLFSKQLVVESDLDRSLQYWFIKITTLDFSPSGKKYFLQRFFNNFLKILNEVVWAPIPLFFLTKSLSKVSDFSCLEVLSLEPLKTFIKESLQTQSICIRGAIQCLMLQFIIKSADGTSLDLCSISDLLLVFRNDECLKRGTKTWTKVTAWLKTFINEGNASEFVFESVSNLTHGVDLNISGLARFTVLLSDADLLQSLDLNSDNSRPTATINNLFTIFKDCAARPYIDLSTVENLLYYMVNVIKESQCVTNLNDDVEDRITICDVPVIQSVIESYANDIFLFIRQKLNSLHDKSELDYFYVYFNFLNVFMIDPRLFKFIKDNDIILSIITDAYNILKASNEKPLKKYFSIKIVCIYCEFIFIRSRFCVTNSLNQQHSNFINKLLKCNCINEILIKYDYNTSSENFALNKNDENMWNVIVCEYINCCWIAFHYHLEFFVDSLDCVINNKIADLNSLLSYGLEALEIGGREIVLNVNKVFKKVLPLIVKSGCISESSVIRFISMSWVSCFELRKLDVFWNVFKSWVEMVFQQTAIRNDYYRVHLVEYANMIFDKSESVSGLANVFVTHLWEEISDIDVLNLLCETVLIKALLFGPVHRKDLRTEYETCLYIKSMGSEFSINKLKPLSSIFRDDREVRLKSLDLIIKSIMNATCNNVAEDVNCDVSSANFRTSEYSVAIDGITLLTNVIKSLLEFDDNLSHKKQRYFNDSLHHRIKNRTLQSLLVLQHVISCIYNRIKLLPGFSHAAIHEKEAEIKELHEKIVEWISNNLYKESQQPSIRYQLEWLLVRCILCYPELVDTFWKMFSKGSEERTGSVCSFISVAYHLAAIFKQPLFTERSIHEILQWCMAQHFNIRLYAQVALIKLLELLESSSDDKLPAHYQIIKNSLLKSLQLGTSARSATKLMSDFYFSVFHPIEHFSLKSLYNDLPRLSCLSPDECISDDDILSLCFKSIIDSKLIPFYDNVCIDIISENGGRTCRLPLSQCQPASWTVKLKSESSEQDADSDAVVIQKKFVPWNVMQLDSDIDINTDLGSADKLGYILRQLKQHNVKQSKTDEFCNNESDLIVVASLIDRSPNLGGLCRTCQIFGVKELVLDGLHYLNDKQFTSLSMSSEKHINITEVKQYYLKNYLLTMKQSNNYTLVGAEQTATGIKLNEFRFPSKTLLLLGNEKEGIPASLLPLLDVCVEIPQLGVVRSLNVHVTGAIFIWEFTKQHRFCSSRNDVPP